MSAPDSSSIKMIAETEGLAPEAGSVNPRILDRWLQQALDQQGIDDAERRSAMLADYRRRLAQGEPLQYVLGTWQFRWLELRVDPRGLIPRPETELLVDLVAIELGHLSGSRVLELGTGTGAIAAAVATECKPGALVATDCSEAALELARENLVRLGLEQVVELRRGSWWEALADDERFDVICSNPPYVTEAEWVHLPSVVRAFEPSQALVAGPTGLECYEAIFADVGHHLSPSGGVLALEIGASQANDVSRLARDAGFCEVDVHQDLAGRDRFVIARWRHERGYS
jgi:release factor glutamine methyltransferase